MSLHAALFKRKQEFLLNKATCSDIFYGGISKLFSKYAKEILMCKLLAVQDTLLQQQGYLILWNSHITVTHKCRKKVEL